MRDSAPIIPRLPTQPDCTPKGVATVYNSSNTEPRRAKKRGRGRVRGRGPRGRRRKRGSSSYTSNSGTPKSICTTGSPISSNKSRLETGTNSRSDENAGMGIDTPAPQTKALNYVNFLYNDSKFQMNTEVSRIQAIRDEINKLKYQRDTINQQIQAKEHELRRIRLQKVNELQTILNFYNFTTREVNSEGDCFFDSLQCHLTEATVEGLRQITADRLQHLLDSGELEGFGWDQTRIDAVRTGREWAGQEEINCIAKASAIKIQIWTFENGDLKTCYQTDSDDDFDVYDFLHCNLDDPFCETPSERNHYMPLFRTNEMEDAIPSVN